MESSEKCCICNDVCNDIKSTVQCNACGKCYHGKCANIEFRGFHMKRSAWNCNKCVVGDENKCDGEVLFNQVETGASEGDSEAIKKILKLVNVLIISNEKIKETMGVLLSENKVLKTEIRNLKSDLKNMNNNKITKRNNTESRVNVQDGRVVQQKTQVENVQSLKEVAIGGVQTELLNIDLDKRVVYEQVVTENQDTGKKLEFDKNLGNKGLVQTKPSLNQATSKVQVQTKEALETKEREDATSNAQGEATDSDGFVQPRRRRTRYRTKETGKAADVSEEFKGVPRQIWLYLTRVAGQVTIQDIERYLKGKPNMVDRNFVVEELTNNFTDGCSTGEVKTITKRFRIGADFDLKEQMYDSGFWPKGIRFARYFWKRGIENTAGSVAKSGNFRSSQVERVKKNDVLKFHIHDEEHTVRIGEMPSDMTLNKYLRKVSNLTGTKYMCLEGGCGVCIVAVSFPDPVTQKNVTIAVNSCLVPLYSCSGWKIFTADGLGNSKSGFHPTQKALVQFNGTQCGYCTPGMVMNMYALYENQENVTMKEVENSFGGNICRCTGYRPILTAFKSLASDVDVKTLGSYADIEDIPICKRDRNCQMKCKTPCKSEPHMYEFQDSKWYKVYSINEIFDILKGAPDQDYMIVGGNTATGVYKRPKGIKIFIDISCAKSLLEHSMADNKLILGANMTLTNAINLFNKLSEEHPNFSYLKKLAIHIDLIANVPVRNIGTLAGNLFTKHQHPEFPSDVFLILATAGAVLTLVNIDGKEVQKDLVEFLSHDMKNTIIKNIILPSLDKSYKYESYKIMPRAQNAHALVNAGFLVQLGEKQEVKSIRIVYGSINPDFVHAQATEGYLVGKDLFNNDTIQGALEKLAEEIVPDYVLPDPTPKFRKDLALALFYKFVLSIAPDDKVSPLNKSGGTKFSRPVSTGTQDFTTNESLYPLTQPISKLEALDQCTGKAQYIMDVPDHPDQLFAAFVLAEAAPYSVITKIDTSEALKLPGVKAYFDKNDIPGENTFTPIGASKFYSKTEELFCSGVVKFYYQPIGIVVATSQELAEEAAELVQISYTVGKSDPHFTVREILANNAKDKIISEGKIEAKTKGKDVKHVIKGTFDIGWQYHYQMETQCCVVIPVEGGLDMFPSTQDMQCSQVSAAKLLNIPVNKVNVSVRRLGGAYGSKISRNSIVSCSAALAAYKLQKPVKFSMSLVSNMNVIGKRNPFSSDYEVGIDDEGVVQYLNTSLYSDLGSDGGNENASQMIMHDFCSTYKSDIWSLDMFTTRTDNHTGTWCRGPGTLEAIGCIENIMQHIAVTTNLDPIAMRLKNVHPDYPEVGKYLNDLVEWAQIKERKSEIEKFNKENRWIKRGIAAVPLHYPLFLFGNWHSHISIFQADGSVMISHGGVEMGQGINTKVAQVCAYALGIPLNQVRVQPSQVLIAANGLTTGGSVTSESVCYATLKAVDILKERMKPIKDKMSEPVKWIELVQKCYMEEVNLSASFMYHSKLPDLKPYPIFGATCVETEVDILTGNTQIKRVDIIEDTGDSISPQVDIGQVEGSFIMGLGYWTSEQLMYSVEGKLLNNRTWTYKPPGAKDIPIDFRVKFPHNNPNKIGILNSKATGEPPMCMTVAVPLAIRDAVASARLDSDPKSEKWYPIDGPSTVESTFENSLNDYKQYKL